MTSRAAYYRKRMKEEDPDAYAAHLERQRLSNQKRRQEEKRQWEEGQHTRAQIEEHRAKLKAKSDRELARYYKKKREQGRQTRNSQIPEAKTPQRKRLKEMTEDERRAYNAMMRKKQRDARSSQKKTADNMKQRKRRQEKKQKDITAKLTAEQQREGSRLPKKAYNLNYEFKSKSKELQLTNEEYARTTLNLLNPRTPEKRVAIAAMQERHPCRVLFTQTEEVIHDVEDELGIDVEDEDTGRDAEVIECSNATHDLIQAFYRQDDISRMLPHARYTTKHGAARVLTKTIKAAFLQFKELNPEVQVGLTLFQQQRPKNIRLLGSVPVESCLCIYCTNVRLKINSLNKILGFSGRLPSEEKLLNFINCPVDGKWNNIECIDGQCDLCKDRLRPLMIFCRDILHIKEVSWKRWIRAESGKMEPVTKIGSVKDLLEEFNKDLVEPSRGVSFAQHLFTAYWQYDQYKINRRNPADGEIVMVQDFAENRKAVYAEEIKSAHFGKGQITVHPMVCFYRRGDDIVRHSVLVFSDDIGHDYHAVNSFTLATIEILKKEGIFTKLTMWSDGAASQYKGKGTFADLSLITGLEVQRCFYGSEHGKGEADGETGVLSQILRRACAMGLSFVNAQDMVSYLMKNHAINTPRKKRQYIILNKINRDRPETEVQTIPGTRSYHQFRRLAPYVIQSRRLACFCTGCIRETGATCVNHEYVGKFVTHKLKPSIQTTLNEAFIADEEPSQSICNVSKPTDHPEVKIGDYLRLTCEINKLKKTFFAVVIPSPVASNDFYVRFFKQASGQAFVFGDVPDEGLISKGAPDFYTWEIVAPNRVRIDNRGHYYFK